MKFDVSASSNSAEGLLAYIDHIDFDEPLKICHWALNSWGKLEARAVTSIKFDQLDIQDDLDFIVHLQFNDQNKD